MTTMHAETADTPAAPGTTCVAVVVPLAEGRCEMVRDFLDEGPPFDPEEVGLTAHKVFLTEHEVVFVFESPDGAQVLDRIFADPEFRDVVSAWQRCSASEPRLGTEVYSWPRRRSASEA